MRSRLIIACAVPLIGLPAGLSAQGVARLGPVYSSTSIPPNARESAVLDPPRARVPGSLSRQDQVPLSTSLAYGLVGGFVGGAVGFYTVPFGVFVGAPVGFLIGVRLSDRSGADGEPETEEDGGGSDLTWPLLGAGLGGVAAVIQGSNDDDFVCDERGCRDPRSLSDEQRAALYAGSGLVLGIVVNLLRDDTPDAADLSISVAPSLDGGLNLGARWAP